MQLLCWFLEVISKALSHLFVLFFPSTKNNLNYQKYPEKDRSKIGKYVSENGSIAGVRKFIQGLTSSLQCNILRFGPKHEKDTRKVKKKSSLIPNALPKKKSGRILILLQIMLPII